MLNYSDSKSARSLGGYAYEYDLGKSIPNDNLQNAFIDYYTKTVTIEFFLKNLQFDLIIYTMLTTDIDYSGIFSFIYKTTIVKTNIIIGSLDYPKLIFELMFIAMIIYYLIKLVNDLAEENHHYDKWQLDQIEKLSSQTQNARKRSQPEVFRKINYLITFDVFLNMLLLGCSIYLIYLRLHLLIFEISCQTKNPHTGNISINDWMNGDIYELRNRFYKQIDTFEEYMIIAGIILFVASLHLLKSLSIGKYFSILLNVLYESRNYNFNFTIIIVILQIPFACYSFIAFGQNTRLGDILGFYSFKNAILSCFLLLFGNYYLS